MQIIEKLKKQITNIRSDASYIQLGSMVAGGNIISSIFRLVGGLLTARFLAPADLGLFNGLCLILGYLPFFQLGVLNGLNRELPYFIGKNEIKKAKELAQTAQIWALFLGLASFIIFLLISCYYLFFKKEYLIGSAWVAISLNAFHLFYGQQYLTITYRTNNDFKKLSLIVVLTNSVALIAVFFVKIFGYFGLVGRSILTGLTELLLLYKSRPLKIIPLFDKQSLIHLMKIGAPIFGVGYFYSMWSVLDSTLVLRFLGIESFGLYQLSLITLTTLTIIPTAFTQVLYPKLALDFGTNNDSGLLIKKITKPILLLFFISLPISIIVWKILPLFVELFLPNYRNGMDAANWTIFLIVFGSFTPIQVIFNVTKNQTYHFKAIFIGIIFYLLALFILSSVSLKLVIFPQSMLVGRLFYLFASLFFLYKLKVKQSDGIK